MNDNDTFFFMYIVWNTWQITDRHILSLCNASWSWIVNEIIYIFPPLYLLILLLLFIYLFFLLFKILVAFHGHEWYWIGEISWCRVSKKINNFSMLPWDITNSCTLYVTCWSLNFNLFPAVESLTNRGHLNKRSRTELYFSGAGRGI